MISVFDRSAAEDAHKSACRASGYRGGHCSCVVAGTDRASIVEIAGQTAYRAIAGNGAGVEAFRHGGSGLGLHITRHAADIASRCHDHRSTGALCDGAILIAAHAADILCTADCNRARHMAVLHVVSLAGDTSGVISCSADLAVRKR